ncbi:Integrase core domain protein [Maioricimonas rarisocia]|uniref:Integrase core domain protein n=1 Tax=Maioricimonas rarisocia TaxID=2528026 RepID=A0A517ZAW6_9PLAN|nr:Integrase core domain protein [Maioricimonas rarisocia]
MIPRLIHRLLVLIATATDRELAQALQYLKVENRILRDRLPKAIRVTPAERRQLLRFGTPLGTAISDLITIVTPRTFRRWVTADNSTDATSRKTGRPGTAAEMRQMITKLARETGWGYGRIQGELRRLGFEPPSISTIRNILKSVGIDPAPRRSSGTWCDFLARHASTLWACDFFTKQVWTLFGPVEMYLLVFIQIETRHIWISRGTQHPDSAWVAQQARNATMEMQDREGDSTRFLIHDRDTKFTKQFDGIFESSGVKVMKLPIHSPNLNAHCERVIQSIKQEVLDHFIVFGEHHLNHLVQEYAKYYHQLRPHQGIDNRVPLGNSPPSPRPPNPDELLCQHELGGVLKHYVRKAA